VVRNSIKLIPIFEKIRSWRGGHEYEQTHRKSGDHVNPSVFTEGNEVKGESFKQIPQFIFYFWTAKSQLI
jgi:hypothetical protein